jgi:PHD/YefM family antitoxin component YafN of YafNO toxin-antitoxin module
MIREKVTTSKLMSSLVSISRFNRGEANKIFNEVDQNGVKVVLKNNEPVSVLMSPAYYEELMEALEDYALYFEAEKRMKVAQDHYLSSEEVMAELGINDADLDDVEVEIE